jgi:hypothetical protein
VRARRLSGHNPPALASVDFGVVVRLNAEEGGVYGAIRQALVSIHTKLDVAHLGEMLE